MRQQMLDTLTIFLVIRALYQDRSQPATVESQQTYVPCGLYSPVEKRQVLEFITGVGRPPAVGSGELLRIEMPFMFIGEAEQRAAIGTLPQAHTCSNTLELPNYCEAWGWQCEAKQAEHAMSDGDEPIGNHDDSTEATTTGVSEPELALLVKERLLLAACGSSGYALDEL